MAVKLLVLGLPGSGKSTIARYITNYLKDRNWEGNHVSDHKILEEMFLADNEHKQFKPAKPSGFDVIDFTVCDTALQRLEQEVNRHLISAKQEEIIFIEFARNDYLRAFQQFSISFLQDAHFIYLNVQIETCKRRIQERITNPNTPNDFNVSEAMFDSYYNKDDGQEIPHILESKYGIDKRRVLHIDNNGLLSNSTAQIIRFVNTIREEQTRRNK